MPRPLHPIDPVELEKLAAMHCTLAEVAAWFGTTEKTISIRVRKSPLKEVWERGIAKGNISLRRTQMQRAEKGDRTMLVWLGKQWLGQRDAAEPEHDVSGVAEYFRRMREGS